MKDYNVPIYNDYNTKVILSSFSKKDCSCVWISSSTRVPVPKSNEEYKRTIRSIKTKLTRVINNTIPNELFSKDRILTFNITDTIKNNKTTFIKYNLTLRLTKPNSLNSLEATLCPFASSVSNSLKQILIEEGYTFA